MARVYINARPYLSEVRGCALDKNVPCVDRNFAVITWKRHTEHYTHYTHIKRIENDSEKRQLKGGERKREMVDGKTLTRTHKTRE